MLAHMIAGGMLLSLLPTATLFLFDDDRSLGQESDALRDSAGGCQLSESACYTSLCA